MTIHPELASALRHGLGGALGWGALGAGLGALGTEKGHRGEGALVGGLTGALVGGATHGIAGAAFGVQEKARRAARAAQAAENATYWGAEATAARAAERNKRWAAYSNPFEAWAEAARAQTGNTTSAHAPGGTPLVAHAPWMAGVTTKADAKAAFRTQARANHPDVGGSTAKMQEVNQQWDAVQGHPDYQKLAFCYDHGRRAALARFGA